MALNKKTTLMRGAIAASVLLASPIFADEPFEPEYGPLRASVIEAMEIAAAERLAASSCLIGAAFDDLGLSWSLPDIRIAVPLDEAIVGVASYYEEPQETASGEQFDPDGFTAAAQFEIRDRFGGIRYGKLYQPAYAVVEYESKKLIVKFNDVGPLRPGRKFDLSRGAMAYLGGLEKGLLPDVRVTPLPLGRIFTAGPVTDGQLAAMRPDADTDVTASAETIGASSIETANDTAGLDHKRIEVAVNDEGES